MLDFLGNIIGSIVILIVILFWLIAKVIFWFLLGLVVISPLIFIGFVLWLATN